MEFKCVEEEKKIRCPRKKNRINRASKIIGTSLVGLIQASYCKAYSSRNDIIGGITYDKQLVDEVSESEVILSWVALIMAIVGLVLMIVSIIAGNKSKKNKGKRGALWIVLLIISIISMISGCLIYLFYAG